MNENKLQGWIDRFHTTSPQQWLLGAVAVLAPMVALAAVALQTGRWWPFGLVAVAAMATVSAVRPDSHTSLVVLAFVAWHWMVSVEPLDTIWLPVTACCMLVHHSVVALMASLPVGGVVASRTLLQWSRRVGLGCGVTVVVWGLAVLQARRDAAGNGLLTAVAVIIAAVGALAIGLRSLDRPRSTSEK